MADENHINLTASEISHLWANYVNDTMSICGFKYFLANVRDNEIRQVIELALDQSENHIKKIREILQAENYPLPQGFTEQDVNTNAPRLFTDVLYLHFVQNMSNFGLNAYGIALSTASRDDVIQYFTSVIDDSVTLHNETKQLLKNKGLYIRDPELPNQHQIDYVERQSFLTGWFGNRRPLLGVEISNLWYNSQRNALGQAIIQGFSQVAKEKEVRKYFERGRDISEKHLDLFASVLHEDYLPQGVNRLTEKVTDSTQAPFSDKLMMYLITALTSSGIGQYGMSISASPRHDLGLMYTRLAGEIMHYSEDGANIMIKYGWMEQPPKAIDRKKISKGE